MTTGVVDPRLANLQAKLEAAKLSQQKKSSVGESDVQSEGWSEEDSDEHTEKLWYKNVKES